jgi:dTDP-4-dehydrorhamnose 3,5-epimerase
VNVAPLKGLPEVLRIEPRVFTDARGRFAELWQASRYAAQGVPDAFVQDNVSVSQRGVLRGLHFQHPDGQGKLVTALQGAVFDVAVDVRRGSPTFGRWAGAMLDAEAGTQLWVPPGFAHGFLALQDDTVVMYKCTAPYVPAHERVLRWDDPAVGIEWPEPPTLVAPRDATAPLLSELPVEALPAVRG